MPSILIVDDNQELASVMGEYLGAKGNKVQVVFRGKAATEKLSQEDFDLLILDWELPDGNGPEICKKYRDDGGMAAVLMLTGRKATEDKVTGLSAGADDYLTKPFNIPEFSARVDALLRRAAMNARQEAPVYDESMVGKTFASCYQIESLLGLGGMGVVYKARHTTLERTAAIKVLSAHYKGQDARKRFEREAKAMSLLDHPNLIKIYEFGLVQSSVPYIIMEYVEGEPLNRILKDCGPIPYPDCLPFFIDICDALQHAHSQSIVHRDLKPSNIIISPDGKTAKVLDLGLARMSEARQGVSELTLAGEVFGSPYYMSPEQGQNSAVDHRSDIYSLGLVIYEVLTGERPFEGDSFLELANAKLKNKAPSICENFTRLNCPNTLDKVIAQALECKAENRQQSMSELKQQLQEVLDQRARRLENKPESKDESGSNKENPLISYFKRILGK